MAAERKMWENLRAEYLNKVKKGLSSVKHPHIAEVLKDVQSHLDQRFAELGPDQQTNENFKAIISQMGPACEYAQLLSGDVASVKRPFILLNRVILATAVIAVVCIGIFIFLKVSVPAGYILTFKPAGTFEPQTAKQLLDVFNEQVRFRVKTHHFRTKIKNNKLIGLICVDRKIDADAVTQIMSRTDKLKFVTANKVSKKQLREHYLLDQLSLSESASVSSIQEPPRVVATWPSAFANDVSAGPAEIKVTFNKPMMNLSWSWVGGGETFPETTGRPRYEASKTTCTLPVKLQPGRFYWIGINSPRFKNFQTDTGVAAVPYVILFSTKDESGNPTDIPDNYVEEARQINAMGR